MSRSLVEAVVPLLAERKLALDDKETLDLLRRFFACLAPGTLRPVDTLLAAVLNSEVDLSSRLDVQRWLGFIVVALPCRHGSLYLLHDGTDAGGNKDLVTWGAGPCNA